MSSGRRRGQQNCNPMFDHLCKGLTQVIRQAEKTALPSAMTIYGFGHQMNLTWLVRFGASQNSLNEGSAPGCSNSIHQPPIFFPCRFIQRSALHLHFCMRRKELINEATDGFR